MKAHPAVIERTERQRRSVERDSENTSGFIETQQASNFMRHRNISFKNWATARLANPLNSTTSIQFARYIYHCVSDVLDGKVSTVREAKTTLKPYMCCFVTVQVLLSPERKHAPF